MLGENQGHVPEALLLLLLRPLQESVDGLLPILLVQPASQVWDPCFLHHAGRGSTVLEVSLECLIKCHENLLIP